MEALLSKITSEIIFKQEGIISVFTIECYQVKEEYENNPELAREKYGQHNFELWIASDASIKFSDNCKPQFSKYITI